ncbi:MAG: carbohydrate kinase family protein [Thermoleophilia bacterium]
MTSPLLVCVGNLTLDEAVQADGARSVELGGDALYAALAAQGTGARVRWLAPVGHDLPAHALDAIAAAGLAPEPEITRDAPTVRYLVTYRADGSRTWELVHGEAHFDRMSVHPEDVPAWIRDAAGVLVCGMSLASQAALVPWLARRTGATVYLDLQEDYLDADPAALRAMVACCRVFLPSEVEAVAVAGTRDLREAVRRLAALGPAVVVIKLADRGCLVLESPDAEPVLLPAVPVTAVDATGAGDAFCGAFAAAHLCGASPLDAARAGAEAARAALAAPGMHGLLARAAA